MAQAPTPPTSTRWALVFRLPLMQHQACHLVMVSAMVPLTGTRWALVFQQPPLYVAGPPQYPWPYHATMPPNPYQLVAVPPADSAATSKADFNEQDTSRLEVRPKFMDT